LRVRVHARRPERRIKSIKRILDEQQQAADRGLPAPRRAARQRLSAVPGGGVVPASAEPSSSSGGGEFKTQSEGGSVEML
jgi:hypothetical protein